MSTDDQQDTGATHRQRHQGTIPSNHSRHNGFGTGTENIITKTADGTVTNPELETFPLNDNNETVYLLHNGEASVSGDTNTIHAPTLPFKRIWISVTLIIVIYIVGMMILGPLTSQYLVYYFTHLHGNLTVNTSSSRSTCTTNSTNTDDDSMNHAQKQASSILLYAALATNIPAFFICLFAGSVSDFLGRKCLLILPLSGIFIKTVILCLIIKLQWDVQLLYIGAAVDGVAGTYLVEVLGVTAVISDITHQGQSKAVRFAIVEGIILVCGSLSQLAVGYLIQAAGFFIPVLLCCCLFLIPLLVTIFVLPETMPKKNKFSWNVGMHLKKTFGFYFSSARDMSVRLQFTMGLLANFTLMFTNIGKSTIETLYVLNTPICWSSAEIGVFGAGRMVIMSLAAVIVLKACKGRLSLEVTGIICGISSVAGFIFEGFAVNTLMMYLSSLVGVLFAAALPLPKAILSQIASSDEQGALFSSMSCMDAIATMTASTLYILIYNATVDTFKGAVFMVIAGICSLNILAFGIFRCLRMPQKDYEHLVENPLS